MLKNLLDNIFINKENMDSGKINEERGKDTNGMSEMKYGKQKKGL